MHPSRTRYIGLDVHTDTLAVADVAQDHGAAVTFLGTIGTRPCDLDSLLRKRPSKATQLLVGYEAGPCGDWRSRDLTTKGSACWVVAPSLIPQKPGARVTTDRRDAGPWARLARSGARTVGDVPQVADEALRDLAWAREDTLRALQSATFRLQAF
jgi:transposase